MKPIVYLPIIVLAALGIGIYQHSRLNWLREEAAELAGADSTRSHRDRSAAGKSRAGTPISTAEVISAESLTEIEALMIHSFEMTSRARGGNRMAQAGQAEAEKAKGLLLLSIFSGMDTQTALDLIQKLQTSETLPPELREHSASFCVVIMMQSSPAGALGLLQLLTDFPNRENVINQCFALWTAAEPEQALLWFEAETKNDNPLTHIPEMIKAATIIQARLNPESALSHEQIEKLIENSGSSERPGAMIAASFHDSREHLAFLGALRREQQKNPSSSELAKIRSEYIQELAGRIEEWTFEEATVLIDSELSPSEKPVAINQISHRSDLADPELWADWFGKIEAPSVRESPQYGYVLGWMRSDEIAAGQWLEQLPSGDLKDRLDFEYAFMLSDKNPAKGMEWAMKIPEGPVRSKAVPRLIKKWKANDPVAAAAFAKANGLAE